MIDLEWVFGHEGINSMMDFEWSLDLTSTSGLECALGLTCLVVGCWFIHAGQGINGGGDHRSRKYPQVWHCHIQELQKEFAVV